jgi:cyclomaltodextrinase / maltogenic alpha-amylase / neopullulanase
MKSFPVSPRGVRAVGSFTTGLLPLLFVLGTACAAPPLVSFDTTGGDAWTFEKRLEGRFSPTACDRVLVQTSYGAVEATLAGERFFANVPLREHVNEVSAACLDGGTEVARSASQRWNVPLRDVPKAWIRTLITATSIVLDAGRSEAAPATPAPIVSYGWRARAGNPAPLRLVSPGADLDSQQAAGEAVELVAPGVDGEYYVELRVTDTLGRTDQSAAVFRVEDGRAVAVDLGHEHPAWVDSAVLYGIAPFFFGEPGFERITERLDEIAELGATAIWLSPVTASPEDDFGYAVLDHFRLRAAFGDEREFRALIGRAHALGLRVLLDFVPNHASERHPYFIAAERDGLRSPYYDWFQRDAAGNVTQYFDWTHLKNFDYDTPEVQNHIIAAFAHWVREFGVDGFRVDASWAVRERAPEFWPRLRAELKRIEPDLFLLAEASARDPYYVDNGFDAAYDWTWNLGEWAWSDVFDGPQPDLTALRAALTNGGAGFAPNSLILRFLNNNDTGARFITRHGVGQTRVAAALLFTVPGLPLIYNGDEVGAAFEPYDEGPPLAWRDTHGLVPYYKRLAKLRRSVPALGSPILELVSTDQDDAVLAYVRPGASAEGTLLVVLNFSAERRRVRLLDRVAVGPGKATDLLTGTKVQIAPRSLAIDVEGFSALVLSRGRMTPTGPQGG